MGEIDPVAHSVFRRLLHAFVDGQHKAVSRLREPAARYLRLAEGVDPTLSAPSRPRNRRSNMY
jgi:hypothetical protein